MSKTSKRMKNIKEGVDNSRSYPIQEAINKLKELSKVKFVESVDVSIKLGVDARKSDQNVRGATILPHGTGRDVRVAVFAQGDNADKAKEAGADVVGFEDLAAKVKKGEIDFDVVIATPDSMRVVGQLGQILGPKGLMPNPKVGTVTADVKTAVENAKAGQVRYRTDKNGIIHCTVGKVDFEVDHLEKNVVALIADLKKLKPSSSKGVYLGKLTLSTTMGPGITIDHSSIAV